MATTWSLERKAKQSQAIRQWQPWSKSTGAKTTEGKTVVSRNAFKGGHRPYMRELAKELVKEVSLTQNLVKEYQGLIKWNTTLKPF